MINSVMTKEGLQVQAKRQIGKIIDYTRIVMGDGRLPEGVTPYTVKQVVNPIVSLGITKLKINNNGTAVVGGVFSNTDLEKEFYYRELALMAYDPDVGEVIYCYGNAGEYAELIAAGGSSNAIEKVIDIVTVVSPTENVTAQLVKTTSAVEIVFDDKDLKIGANDVQGVIEKIVNSTLTAETPDNTTFHSGLYLKLIRSNLNWQTPQSESEAEPLAGYMLLDDGTQKKGAVELDNGDVKDLFLLPT